MSLHILTSSSAAAQLDEVLADDDDILLIENCRLPNRGESHESDPIRQVRKLGRLVMCGRPARHRDPRQPSDMLDVEAINKGNPVVLWSARNLDDALSLLWLFNYLSDIGYERDAIQLAMPASAGPDAALPFALGQMSAHALKKTSESSTVLQSQESSVLQSRWAMLKSQDTREVARFFETDYSALQGLQESFLSVVNRMPAVIWGHAPEALIALECLVAERWDAARAFVRYVADSPFRTSMLREPDARALIARLQSRSDSPRVFKELTEVREFLLSADSDIKELCVPFFWDVQIGHTLPTGVGARVLG